MNVRISRIFLLFLCFIFLAGYSFAANRLIIIAPGESFSVGAGKSGTPDPQTAGVPFNVTVYSVDDAGWTYASTLENVALSASQATSFSPSTLALSQSEGAVSDCKYYPAQVTISDAVSGSVGIYANNSPYNGLAAGTVTVTAQDIDHYYFNAISDQTAGQSFSYTITARDSSNATVTSFNGTGTLTARYSVSGDLYSWGVSFTNGVATGSITIYDATDGENVQLICETSTPAVTTNQNNNTFNVAAGPLDRLLIIGPGQTYLPGTTSGNGRAGTSETTTQQTAGSPFYVTVYACDQYWNTVSGASGTIDLTSSDGQAVFSPAASQALSGGKAIFSADLRTVGGGSQTLQADRQGGGAANDSDTVPVTNNSLSKFGFTSTVTEKTAGDIFAIAATAYDAYNNTVTSFTQSGVTIQLYIGGSPLGSSYWTSSSMNFTNGILGANYVRIFKRTSNATIKLSYSGSEGDSNAFNVNPGTYTKIITIAPGEGYDPGNVSGGKLTYTASEATAGAATLIYVYATDDYGNRVTDIDGNLVRITSSDSAATVDGQPVSPAGVTITVQDGLGSFNVIFQTTRAYPPGQTITGHDETQSSTDGSSAVPVVSSALSYFEIANIPTQTNADTTNTNVRIRAKDEYGNTITDWTGNLWMTCPDADYSVPYESTMNVTGTNVELVGHRWHVTVTAGDLGDKQVAINFRRAMNDIQVFVSDNETDTPTAYSGHIGLSAEFDVNPGSHTQMQVIPPGVQMRPGTVDGEYGTPTGQSVSNPPGSSPFYVTVNAVDQYYNVVTTRQDTVRLSSNIPSNTLVDDQTPSAAPSGVPKALVNGTIVYKVEYTNTAGSSSFYLIANSPVGGVTEGQSQTINIFNIDHFKIEAPAVSDWQEVGEPFTITITAYNDPGETQISNGFTGTVDLSTNRDWVDLGKVIEPGNSIPFTAGICEMDVTIYRASTTAYGSGSYIIYATFGNVTSDTIASGAINVRNKPASDVLIIVEGMQYRPGAKHLGIPGYKGYIGSPRIMEAGDPFQLQVFYVDEYYNQDVYYNDNCKLTSTDSLASENSRWLATDNVYVTMTAGAYPAGAPWANAALRTVGATGQQYFTAEPEGSLPNNTTPPINIKHTDHDHFGVLLPPSRIATAGVAFNVTVQALDAWQNVCDDRNEGTPFEELVNLNSSEGTNTMWPAQYVFSNGQAIIPVQLFKAETFNTHVEATYSAITGTSASNGSGMHVYPNEFERLIVISQEGMTLDNGRFSGTTPTDFPGYAGFPYFSAYGNKVNDGEASGGPASGYQFTVYSCDAYGNITATADVLGHTVTVSTNDPYAVPVTPTAISSSTGSAVFNMIYHTAMEGVSLTAEITNGAIADFTAPSMTTYAGAPYGLQLMVPGLSVTPGSGYVDVSSNWYNGVTGLTNTQLSSVGFPVTVQASDKYGNFVIVSDQVDVWQASPSPSYPTSINRFTGSLGNAAPGILTLTATVTIGIPQYVQFSANDYAGGYTLRDVNEWLVIPTVYVTLGGNLEYVIDVGFEDEIVSYGDGTNSINVVADPDSFTMNVYAVDSVSKQPVYGASQLFQLRPVLASDINTQAAGSLNIASGTTSNGTFLTQNQTYDASGGIRIEISDPGGTLDTKYSCVIYVGANAQSAVFDAYPNPANIRSGQASNVTGNLTYNSTYPVPGEPVLFEFLSASSTGTGTFAGDAVSATAYTDSNGNAIAPFTGDYINGSCVIRVTHLTTGQSEYVTVNVSLVDPILGEVSNYPNPFRAGVESTNISYLLAEATDVKLKIYNLFGDLVLSREFRSGEQYAYAGVMNVFPWDGKNDKGEIVGNGGYICVIEVVLNGSNEKLIRKIAVRK